MELSRIRTLAEDGDLTLRDDVQIEGADPVLPSRIPIGEIAGVALAGLGSAAADLAAEAGGKPGAVKTSVVEGALTTIGFSAQRLNGEPLARTNQSNPFVHCYEAQDERWIYLHGGFPKLAAGLADVLSVSREATFAHLQAAVTDWDAQDLEDRIAERGLCAAIVRSNDEWIAHPQGGALEAELTVTVEPLTDDLHWQPHATRPLEGLRVLDLTRVLAGPTCGKYLAALGADVTNIRSESVPHVPSFLLETGVGKSVLQADLTDPAQLDQVRALAMNSHVVVQGYRPGVVEGLGLDATSLRDAGWAGIYGSINCYGHVGPWADRAGWEQLAQAASGMAHAEGRKGRPEQVPAALNDYVTGLLMANAVTRQLATGTAADLLGSLCQTAGWIMRTGADRTPADAIGIGTPTLQTRQTDAGPHQHLSPGFSVEGLSIGWAGSE